MVVKAASLQDLLDRLVLACEEQDVLFVRVRLHQLKEAASLNDAIDAHREPTSTLILFISLED
jgi:hypothetical protein